MSDNLKNSQKSWKAFRPSKTTWFWSSVGVVIATMVVGFSWGGWVAGGTAQQMAKEAAEKARAQLVAEVCVERYTNSEGFASRLAKLKEASTWDQEDMIEEGRWTDLPGIEEPVENAADVCANELAGMEVPNDPTAETGESKKETTG